MGPGISALFYVWATGHSPKVFYGAFPGSLLLLSWSCSSPKLVLRFRFLGVLMRFVRLSLCFWLLLLVPPVFSQSADSILTNADIVQMSAAGLSGDIIRAKIANSSCQFDTSSKALLDLKAANVSDEIILAMVSGPTKPPIPQASPEQIIRNTAIEQEKENAGAKCPGCFGLMISSFDAASGRTTDNWLTRNQLAYVKERGEKIRKDGLTPHFWYTKYRENADYIVVWSRATGSRAYTTYTPHTSTSTTSISGDVNATATTQTTTYEAQQNEWQYINVVATVYERDGSKKYETFHQGNFRWSKPDKDCLEDVFKFLSPKP
jgi:hypothetical protein